MGMSRIEQLIDDIYEFIESCKMQPLSQTKVIVPKDELYDLLDELKLRTPDEIKRYQKIIANRDAILADAEKKSNEIQDAARRRAESLINENEIVQQAYQQANDIMAEATAQANAMMAAANNDAEQIREGALAYTNDMLLEVENTIADALEATRAKSEALIASLEGNLNIVTGNRKEISDQLNPQQQIPSSSQTPVPTREEDSDDGYSEEDFEFDPDSFLDHVD